MSASERRIAELEADNLRLKRLLGAQMKTGEELEFEAIVNLKGEPLVNLRWDQLAAQLPAATTRKIAMDLLRICEWAEVDATVFRVIEAELSTEAAGGLMAMLREARSGESERSGHAGA